MLSINIIPEELKKEIQLKKVYYGTKRVVFLSSIFLVFYAVIIVGGKYFLASYYGETISKSSIVTKDTQKYTNSAKEINDEIETIEKIQKDNIYWTNFLSSLSKKIEGDIQISSIAVTEKKTLNIKGVSKTRESILDLKEKLEKTEYLQDVNLPLKSLLEKSDINFEFTANFKNYDFSEAKKE